MYAFVFEWTPALTTPASTPPHGLVFSAFMLAYMGGSTAVSLGRRAGAHAATLLVALTAGGLGALVLACALLSAYEPHGAPTSVLFSVFVCFVCLEFCLGAYMPAIAALKAAHVAEDVRATVYNLFRVPLNLVVVLILTVSLDSARTLLLASALFAVALGCAVLVRRTALRRDTTTRDAGGKPPTSEADRLAPSSSTTLST